MSAEFTAQLPTPPSTNNLFVNHGKGRAKSPTYRQWLQDAGWELKLQRPQQFVGRVEVELQMQRDNRRDLDNGAKACLDLLVSHQVIEDDRFIERLTIAWHENAEARGRAIITVRAA